MRRDAIHRLITELDVNEELKEVLRGLIDFADAEDERLYGMVKEDLEEIKMRPHPEDVVEEKLSQMVKG